MIAREDLFAAFSVLTGAPRPVPWQVAFHESLHEGVIPDALDLPTGLGKTSVIPLWLLARAGGAQVPRRLFVVVNNRAVVDQATVVAERLADALDADMPEWSRRDGKERRLLNAIRTGLGLAGGERLPVSTLRGQRADNRAWLQRPAVPAIVIGTVDMIGSRLLFSGYAMSRWSRSLHAGLVGVDSLVVLDESHLVPPFAHLLRAVAGRAKSGVVPVRSLLPDEIAPLRTMFLSATGRGRADNVLGLGDADLADDWVRRRLHAPKRLRVVEVDDVELVDEMASRAVELADGRERIVVFCNGFERTHAIADAIGGLVTKNGLDGSLVIARLTGQIRVRERSALERDPVFRRFLPDVKTSAEDSPAFLVANSAGEVGIDIDADHMVADVVPWERQVQRLGRVNRTGREKPATVDVFAARPPKVEQVERFERWLAPLVHDAWTPGADERRDASPEALRVLKDDPAFRAVCDAAESEESYRPPLDESLIDAWSMTSLARHPARPVVAPWLHGWVDDEAEVTMLWRRHLPGRDHAAAYLEEAPPHLLETLTVPLRTAQSWLTAVLRRERRFRAGRVSADADSEGHSGGASPIVAIVSRHDEMEALDATTLERRVDAAAGSPERLPRAGDVIVLNAAYGGLRPHGVLDAKWTEPPRVWDDLDVISSSPAIDESKSEGEPDRTDERSIAVSGTTDDVAAFDVRSAPEPFDAIPRRWRQGRIGTDSAVAGYRPGRYREPLEERVARDGDESAPLERWIDIAVRDGGSADTRGVRGLDDHHRDVVEAVRTCCATLGLDGPVREALVQAALHHDLGKARELWQRAAGAPAVDARLAKTGRPMNGRLLGGYRHEFGSVSDAKASPAMQALGTSERDLALHLVAAHHGRARPWIAPVDPDEAPPLTTGETDAGDALANEIAHRFDRVQARFGHWTLAWLESLLRTSDWEASRQVDEPSRTGPGERPR